MGWGSGAPFKLRPGPCFDYTVSAPFSLDRLWACIVGSLFPGCPLCTYVVVCLQPHFFSLTFAWSLDPYYCVFFSSVWPCLLLLLGGPWSWLTACFTWVCWWSLLWPLGSASWWALENWWCKQRSEGAIEVLLGVLAAVYLWLGCSQEVKGLAKTPCCPVFFHYQSSINACKVRV